MSQEVKKEEGEAAESAEGAQKSRFNFGKFFKGREGAAPSEDKPEEKPRSTEKKAEDKPSLQSKEEEKVASNASQNSKEVSHISLNSKARRPCCRPLLVVLQG